VSLRRPSQAVPMKGNRKKRSTGLGQESQSCRIIHCLPFLYLACILRFFCSHEHVQIPHTHTCVPYSRLCLHLLRWTCKEASKFLDRLKLSIINHIIRIWSPNRICRIIQSLNRGSVLDCHWLIMSRPTCEYLPNPSRKMRKAP
jgi:hypothetical protein